MHLEELEFKNFCNHKHVKFRPGRCVTGLIGPIGSGKSNILRGIRGLFSGDFGRGDGVKASNVSQFRPEDEDSYVRGVGTHDGFQFELIRRLHPEGSKDVLKLSSEPKPIVGAKNVNAFLEDLFKSQLSVLDRYVFVDQGALGGFFRETTSERCKVFGKIAGLEFVEKIRAKLAKKSSSLKYSGNDPNPELRDKRAALEECRNTLSTLAVSISEKREQLKHLPDASAIAYTIQAIDALVNTRRMVREEENKRDSARSQMQSNEQAAADLEKLILSDEELRSLTAYSQSLQNKKQLLEQRELGRKSLQERIKKLSEKLDSASLSVAVFTTAYATQVDPEVLAGYKSTSEFLSREVATYQHYLEAKKASSGEVCGTCFQPLPEWMKNFDEEAGKRSVAMLAMFNTKIQEAEEFLHKQEERMRSLTDQLASAQENHAEACKQLEALGPEESATLFDAELLSIQERVEVHFDNSAKYRTAYDTVVASKEKLRIAEERLEELKVKEAELTLAAPPHPEDPTSYLQTFRQAEALIDSINKIISESKISQDIHQKMQQKMVEDITALEVKAKEFDKVERVVGNMKALEAMLHPAELPMQVIRRFVEQLIPASNELLASFEAGFQLMLKEDLEMFASFSDGRVQPAVRLSGGQQTLAALSFLISVNSRMAGSLGLLCLDEPTAFLPSYETACLELAIERLRGLGWATGLQVFVSTHERALERLFDASVHLGEPS